MLLLDDTRGSSKDSEGCLALAGVGRLTCLEQSSQKVGPCVSGVVFIVDLFICILSGDFGDGITDLVAERRLGHDRRGGHTLQ